MRTGESELFVKMARFIMAFHCHQPIFNFEWEIERVYKNAYLPLLETLEEFPGIKASFHYSGNMLEWFERKHPDYIEKMKKLMQRNQIELIGGGCFEPVMALIPERDRADQLKMNEEIITRIFGIKPNGAWIAERVWEPALADTLHAAGIKYTILDDYHMLRAGVDKEKLFKPCLMRGENSSITVFPSLTNLRYSMPFRSPEATLDYIKKVTEKSEDDVTCFFFADDGEKFGAWPHTYQWVHKRGWLRDFFLLLKENSAWLQTATYSEIMDTVSPEEIESIPESSYAEMMRWSGGNFKNFLKKYPEIDRMHKRMISVSDMIERAKSENPQSAQTSHLQEAKKELFKAQSSCAYWHGVFGGLYLPHLRSGVYKHLIKARGIVDAAQKAGDRYVRIVEHDLGESKRETVIENKFIDVFVKSFEGGVISELDYKPLNVNLINTMSRIKEAYHKKLRRNYFTRIKQARKAVLGGELADIHDVLGVGERGLRRALFYDDYQRNSFLTHIFKDKRPWKQMHKSRASCDNFLKGTYEPCIETGEEVVTHTLSKRDKVLSINGRPFDLEVVKKITVGPDPAVMFSHKLIKHSDGIDSLRYAVEFNFLIWDKAVIKRPRLAKTSNFSLKDRYSGINLDFSLNREFTVFMYPVYTVNETESGLKKTFQGVSVLVGDEYDFTSTDTDEMKITMAIG